MKASLRASDFAPPRLNTSIFPWNLWLVHFLSSPLKNPGFHKVFRVFGKFLRSSVAPMLARCMAPAALNFASRCPKRVDFRVALGRQKTGVLDVPPLARSTPVEGTGRQLNFLSLGWPEKASPGSGLVFGVERRRGHTTCRGRPSTTGPFVDF
jgi:hypothetical protein